MDQKIDFIKQKSEELITEITDYRRLIHSNPELSFEEHKTTAFIKEKLDEAGIKNISVTETGLVGIIGKEGPCVALRADIDALPIKENTGLEFASINDGVMHACGHDMHTAMLLGASKILKSIEDEIPGTVKLIFQPGEEKIPGGASIMIEKGVLEDPAPEVVFGQHINPGAQSGTLSFVSGPAMASADEIYLTIKARGSHAAQPHIGSDAILTASTIINHLQTLITKFRNPLQPGVISITSIHGGSAPNIYPDEVKLMGTMRAFNQEWRENLHSLIKQNIAHICDMYNTQFELEIRKGYPALINNENTTDFIKDIAEKAFGSESVEDFEPKMWAEDFAYFAQIVPSTFWFLGVRPAGRDEMPPLHNSRLDPDEKAMTKGMALPAIAAYNYLLNKKAQL
ncbi:MAG: M20 family metallopeptidase [Candidatus Kapaibacterium sp.]